MRQRRTKDRSSFRLQFEALEIRLALTRASGDFNGDGHDDLAIAVPYAEVSGMTDAGAVHVIYGTNTGLSSNNNQVWHQDSPGIQESAANNDHFGEGGLAIGDFNGDGFDDLAIGCYREGKGGYSESGVVHVIYGSAAGLTSANNQLWWQDVPGVNGYGDTGEQFGYVLAAGNFNGDAYDDLAIGVPRDVVEGDIPGGVNVLYGTSNGISAVGDQLWTQDSPGIDGRHMNQEKWGVQLAVGDFNGDGYDDLAVGSPLDVDARALGTGNINIIYGSANKLTGKGDQLFSVKTSGVPVGTGELPESGDRNFGAIITKGDFDGDGFDDLAVGLPDYDDPDSNQGGTVVVLFGEANKFLSSRVGSQFGGDHTETPSEYAIYAFQLVSGDFYGDGRDDLAVSFTFNSVFHAVHVLNGHPVYGFDTSDFQLLLENDFGRATFEGFGNSLAAGDFDGDEKVDLAIGSPLATIGGNINAGVVDVIYGSSAGLDEITIESWHRDTPGILEVAASGDLFGVYLPGSRTEA